LEGAAKRELNSNKSHHFWKPKKKSHQGVKNKTPCGGCEGGDFKTHKEYISKEIMGETTDPAKAGGTLKKEY